MSISAVREKAAPDAVAERPGGDQRAGDEKAVEVDDPEELHARRREIRGELGHGEVQDREVHRIKEAGERDHGEADPLAPPGT
jgi:hypothetical protein